MLAFLALLTLAAPVRAAASIDVVVKDRKGRPVEGALVYVVHVPGRHKPPRKPVVMDQVDRLFVPHVLPVVAGAKVSFPNKDQIHHHVYSFSKPKKLDLPLYKDKTPEPPTFETPGVVKLGCNIHDWMLGYIVVLQNPFFALTDARGKARLSGMKAGEHRIAVWSGRRKQPVEETYRMARTGKTVEYALAFGPVYAPVKHEGRY